jgi:glycosyltransferase involved in cell wall biosynthesis
MRLMEVSASCPRALLGVVPSLGGSFTDMARHGQLERLLDYYVPAWLESFRKVRFFSFEPERIEELTADPALRRRVEVVAPAARRRRRIQALMMGHGRGRRLLRECGVVRVLQAPGGLAPALASARFVCTYGYAYPRFTDVPFQGRFADAVLPLKRRLMRAGLRFIVRRALVTIVTSQEGEVEARALGAQRVEHIPNGVDVELFVPDDVEKAWDIVFVGRLAPQKDLPVLLDAAAMLDGVRVAVVGDGPLRDELICRASHQGIDLTLLGPLRNSDVASVLKQSRCFVLPSTQEGHPKALLEALASGVPCVGSRIPAIVEMAREGVVATFEQGDAAELAAAVRRILSDETEARRLSERGRGVVVERFDLRKLLRVEVELLTSLAHDRID